LTSDLQHSSDAEKEGDCVCEERQNAARAEEDGTDRPAQHDDYVGPGFALCQGRGSIAGVHERTGDPSLREVREDLEDFFYDGHNDQ